MSKALQREYAKNESQFQTRILRSTTNNFSSFCDAFFRDQEFYIRFWMVFINIA